MYIERWCWCYVTVVLIFCCCICYYCAYFSYLCAVFVLLSFLQKHVSSSLTVITALILFSQCLPIHTKLCTTQCVCEYGWAFVEFKEQSCTHSLVLTSLWLYNGKSIGIAIAWCCRYFCVFVLYTRFKCTKYESSKYMCVCMHEYIITVPECVYVFWFCISFQNQ